MATIIHSSNVEHPQSRVQIYCVKTKRWVLEINDALNLDPAKHKIQFVLISLKGEGDQSTMATEVRHWVDVARFKAVCRAIIEGRLEAIAGIDPAQIREGNPVNLWEDMKGSPRDGGFEARIFTLRFAPADRVPYKLVAAKGHGQQIGEGAVKMVGPSTANVMVSLSRLDMYTLANEVLDYVSHWEQANWQGLQDAKTITLVPATTPKATVAAAPVRPPAAPKATAAAPARSTANRPPIVRTPIYGDDWAANLEAYAPPARGSVA